VQVLQKSTKDVPASEIQNFKSNESKMLYVKRVLSLNWVMSIGGRPKPEIWLLPGKVRSVA